MSWARRRAGPAPVLLPRPTTAQKADRSGLTRCDHPRAWVQTERVRLDAARCWTVMRAAPQPEGQMRQLADLEEAIAAASGRSRQLGQLLRTAYPRGGGAQGAGDAGLSASEDAE